MGTTPQITIMEITMKRTRMELVKHYWKCEYERNACPLEPWGDVIDVHHGDSLDELFMSTLYVSMIFSPSKLSNIKILLKRIT